MMKIDMIRKVYSSVLSYFLRFHQSPMSLKFEGIKILF